MVLLLSVEALPLVALLLLQLRLLVLVWRHNSMLLSGMNGSVQVVLRLQDLMLLQRPHGWLMTHTCSGLIWMLWQVLHVLLWGPCWPLPTSSGSGAQLGTLIMRGMQLVHTCSRLI